MPGLKRRRKGVSNTQGRHLAAALSKLFSWLHELRHVKGGNPAIGMYKPKAPAPRDRTLAEHEVRWFWTACDQIGEPYGAVLKLLLLTGQRLSEVTGMRFDELSDDGTVWTLPKSRTKNKKEHHVYLSRQAQAIIGAAKRIGGPYVFTITGTRPVSVGNDNKRALDGKMLDLAREERGAGYEFAHWQFHDLRRTFVTDMADLGVDLHVTETCVNHISGHKAGVAGVYNKSQYTDKTRIAWQRWADAVESIAAGRQAEVIKFPAAEIA